MPPINEKLGFKALRSRDPLLRWMGQYLLGMLNLEKVKSLISISPHPTAGFMPSQLKLFNEVKDACPLLKEVIDGASNPE
jgi:hypothetical protein